MRPSAALLVLGCVLLFPPLLGCSTTCQMMRNGNSDYVEGLCPVTLTPAPQAPAMTLDPGRMYSQCVTLRVWMRATDLRQAPRISIVSPSKKTLIRPTRKKMKCKHKWIAVEEIVRCYGRAETHQHNNNSTNLTLWEVTHDCVNAEGGAVVFASYVTSSTSCNVSYTVPDPVPNFNLSVNQTEKSLSVSVEPGQKAHARWCYQRNAVDCVAGSSSPQITLDPSQSPSAVLHFPFLLPCVCVQVYYTHRDARREKKCPFHKDRITDASDVWRSSDVVAYEWGLLWRSQCPVHDMNVSVALCWKQHEHLCIPVLNSTLEAEADGPNLMLNTSAVDKHPRVCLQFSLQGSQHFTCPFHTDQPSWEASVGSGQRSLLVSLTSLAPATFSVQLCVASETGCSPVGPIHVQKVEQETTQTRIEMPPHLLLQRPCVQVWRSDLRGRRILCLDYTHSRCGLYAVAVLILVVVVALLGFFIYCLMRSGAAGWLRIQKEVLLVCSSDQSAHISAACALASVLQGELNATVHMSLWAQSSRGHGGTGAGVADVGPLPWLYGQWEKVRKARGQVLIIWSPEAKRTYDAWTTKENAVEGKREKSDEDFKGKRPGKGRKERDEAGGTEDCEGKDWPAQREHSSAIAPVFAGALACLQGALQQQRGADGVAIVYFQGFGHSRDVPKELRAVPRYCLPQDFRGLITELGGMKSDTWTGQCCPRLLSKVQSMWSARQLTRRLRTLLSVTSVPKATRGDKGKGEAGAADSKKAGEQEPLQGSPWRG